MLKICLTVATALLMAVSVLCAQDRGLVMAHRGGAHEFDENTLAAFLGSYEKGLRGFETDVRTTKDGDLVILHDATLDRTYEGMTGRVEEKTAAELRGLKTKQSGQPFLFLDDLLAAFADKPGVYFEFEMKTDKDVYTDEVLETYCKKLYDSVSAKCPEGSFYVFTSFDQRPLKVIKRLDPQADVMYITGGPCTEDIVKMAQELGARRVACGIDQTSQAQVRNAQKAGFRVNLWPGHTVEDYELGIALGADVLCTDIPVKVMEWKNSKK
ncbi:MAG: hypothetical protein FWH27_16950 [Planctomycetaceae bacterium]|nr:hypothetical protein [Planctomycetaceae bacterium]